MWQVGVTSSCGKLKGSELSLRSGAYENKWAMGPWATLGAGPLVFPRNPSEKRDPEKWTLWAPKNALFENIFGKMDPEKRPSGPISWGPGRAIFGISWKFAARGATRHLIWSREGPNQAIFENPNLGQLVVRQARPGRPGQAGQVRRARPTVNQATHQPGLGGGLAGP